MKQGFMGLYALFCASVAGFLYRVLSAESNNLLPDLLLSMGLERHISILVFILAFFLSVCTLGLALVLPYSLMFVTCIRRKLFPEANLEGYWYQHVSHAERPHSLSKISWKLFSGWHYTGHAYSSEGKLKAQWECQPISFDKVLWVFKGESERFANNIGFKGNLISTLYFSKYMQSMSARRKVSILPGRVFDLDFDGKPMVASINLQKIELTLVNPKFKNGNTYFNSTDMKEIIKYASSK